MLHGRCDGLSGGGIPDPRGLIVAGRDERRPSGLNAAWFTVFSCFMGGAMGCPVEASQTRAVASKLAVTIRRPSGLNAACNTAILCSSGGAMGCPVAAFQTCAVLSQLAVTMRRPSGLNAAWATSPPRCNGGAMGCALAAFQTRAVMSPPAVTMRCPSGLNAVWNAMWSTFFCSCFMGGEVGSPMAASQYLRRMVFAGGEDASPVGAERGVNHAVLVLHGRCDGPPGGGVPDPAPCCRCWP